ncbi:hypothetical protein [Williamsia sp. CHRR-6]|uniref:hypothetical protein n=1 Tax=Williamsia sp. CHRR-6 TaxID=2835871 RepID=UPI001BDB1FD2|nr:hypothetical protein [Williamsia sp. CHRR-6]MBT0566193.1 hypothetical protein [Williamsia sp. CHRR-6]
MKLAGQTGQSASTVHAVRTRCRINRLSYVDRVTIDRVLSDNGSAYRSHTWRDACAELGGWCA